MSTSKKTLQSQANKLRKEIAEDAAKLDDKKARLAKIEATLAGVEPPKTGLDLLWEVTPKMARLRSSRHVCRVAWNKIPPAERPTIEVMVEAMKKWARCDEWLRDGGQFIPALDRWISERRWEDAPEVRTGTRYTNIPKPAAPEPSPEDVVTDRSEIRKLLRGES